MDNQELSINKLSKNLEFCLNKLNESFKQELNNDLKNYIISYLFTDIKTALLINKNINYSIDNNKYYINDENNNDKNGDEKLIKYIFNNMQLFYFLWIKCISSKIINRDFGNFRNKYHKIMSLYEGPSSSIFENKKYKKYDVLYNNALKLHINYNFITNNYYIDDSLLSDILYIDQLIISDMNLLMISCMATFMKSESVELLLQKGADVNCMNKTGTTPLMVSAIGNNEKALEILLKAGASVNVQNKIKCNALLYAISMNNYNNVLALIQAGADINMVDQNNTTPLILAASCDDHKIIDLLISLKVDINAKNSDGNTALHVACYKNKILNVHSLIKAGADITVTNDNDNTPLMLAVVGDNRLVVKFLSNINGIVNQTTNGQMSALHKAICENKPEIVQILIDGGADVNIVNEDNVLPLFLALHLKNFAITKILINNGASLKPNIHNITPLMYAVVECDENMVNFILDSGVDINEIGKGGNTALYAGVFKNSTANVKILLDKNADHTISNNDNDKLLQIAFKNKNKLILKYLLDAGVDF